MKTLTQYITEASKPVKEFEGQCLHAKTIGFVHPNGEYLEFSSELPEYFKDFLRRYAQ